jgi:predicted RNA-binding protein
LRKGKLKMVKYGIYNSNYWVYPITEDSLKICLELGIIGAKGNNAYRLKKWKPGDLIIFYVSRERFDSQRPVRKFCAIAECIGYSFNSAENIFPDSKTEEYPTRIKIKALSNKKCEIKPLIEQLDFIKNKKNYGSAFISGTRNVSAKDFNIIRESMK